MKSHSISISSNWLDLLLF